MDRIFDKHFIWKKKQLKNMLTSWSKHLFKQMKTKLWLKVWDMLYWEGT